MKPLVATVLLLLATLGCGEGDRFNQRRPVRWRTRRLMLGSTVPS